MVVIILVIANNHQSDCDIEAMSTCSSDCLSNSPQFEACSLCTHEPDYNFLEHNLPEVTDNRPPSLKERKPPYKQKARLYPNWKPPDKNRASSTLLTGYSIFMFIGIIFLGLLTPARGNIIIVTISSVLVSLLLCRYFNVFTKRNELFLHRRISSQT